MKAFSLVEKGRLSFLSFCLIAICGSSAAVEVTSILPSGGSHNAAADTNLQVTLDTDVDSWTVNGDTFVLHREFQAPVPGSYGTDGHIFSFDPVLNFNVGEVIQSTVTSGVEAGGVPVNPYVWYFRTSVPNGTGEFTDSGQSLLFFNSIGLSLGDLDGDSDLDAFVINFSQCNLVWLNDGHGHFTNSGQSLGDNESQDVALGDLDRDGDLDAFVANSDFNRIWMNDGNGVFTDSGQSLGYEFCHGVSLGDLDGDGDLDAIVVGYYTTDGIWLNDGSGFFIESGQTMPSYYISDVALGDLDSDGDLDAIIANRDDTGNRVMFNDGNANFTEGNQSIGSYTSKHVVLGDTDGDGDLDAIVTNTYLDNRIWVNSGNGNFTDSGQFIGYSQTNTLTLSDLDGDGDLDIFGATSSDNWVRLNDGDGNFGNRGRSMGNYPSIGVALGDLDHDGDLDAFTANFDQGNRVWMNRVPPCPTAKPKYVQLKSVFPVGETHTAPLNTTLLVTVDAAWIPDTVNSSNFIVHREFRAPIDGSFTIGRSTFGFNPIDLFYPGELIQATATRNIETNRGIVTPYVWCFRTRVESGSGAFVDTMQSLGVDDCAQVALGDLDCDGDLDVFSANHSSNRIWLNGGDGYFMDSGQSLGDSHSTSVSLGDLDNDGDLDAFVTNFNEYSLIWLNDGNGYFIVNDKAPVSGDLVTDLALGDLDGDGDLDAFLTEVGDGFHFEYGHENTVWLNDGNSNFTNSGQSLGDNTSNNVALGDIDNDGDLDAFVTNIAIESYGGNCIWLNKGHGFFTRKELSMGYSASSGVSLGDLNGDGSLDVFLTNPNNESDQVLFNDGAGNFMDSGQNFGDTSSSNVSLGDLDGDGDLDCCITNFENEGNRFWLNNGIGGFMESDQILMSNNSVNISLGDLDRDGDLDAFIAGNTAGHSIWLNQVPPTPVPTTNITVSPAGGSNTAPVNSNLSVIVDTALDPDTVNSGNFVVSGGFHSPVTGSFITDSNMFTFDPSTDFHPGETIQATITQGVESSGLPVGPYVWCFITAATGGSGTFVENVQYPESNSSRSVALGDLDGDSDLDAMVANYGLDNAVYLNDGSGYFTNTGQNFGNTHSMDISLGDLDGDGDLDAFVANYYYNEISRILFNDGSGVFTESGQILENSACRSIALCDLDGDGDLDAFLTDYGGNGNRVFFNTGSGYFEDSGQVIGSHVSYEVALGDLDSDGDLDAFIVNSDFGDQVWLNDGNAYFFISNQELGWSDGRGVSLGDVDSDGDLDALVANYQDRDILWKNTGDGNFDRTLINIGDFAGNKHSLGDVDGDGDLDAFVANYMDYDKVWLNVGSGYFQDSGQTLDSTNSKDIALGDFDNDGDLDAFIVTINEGNRIWLNQDPVPLSQPLKQSPQVTRQLRK